MSRKISSGRWIGIACLALVSSLANTQAQVVTFNFSGTLTYLDDPNSALPSDIQTGISGGGIPYTGTVTYDAAGLQDSYPADPLQAAYPFNGATANNFDMTVTFGAHTLTINPTPPVSHYIGVFVNGSSHLLEYVSRSPKLDGANTPGNVQDVNASLTLNDNSKTALSSDAIPTTAPALNKFGDAYFQYMAMNGVDNFTLSGTIASITPVPEPTTTGLAFAAGLIGFGLWRNRRRQQA